MFKTRKSKLNQVIYLQLVEINKNYNIFFYESSDKKLITLYTKTDIN